MREDVVCGFKLFKLILPDMAELVRVEVVDVGRELLWEVGSPNSRMTWEPRRDSYVLSWFWSGCLGLGFGADVTPRW